MTNETLTASSCTRDAEAMTGNFTKIGFRCALRRYQAAQAVAGKAMGLARPVRLLFLI